MKLTGPPSRRQPLRQQSDKGKARQQTLTATKRIILTRDGWKCSGCGSKDYALDDHHVFNRGQLGLPWEDLPECRTALCVNDPRDGHQGCHERVQREIDVNLRDHLRKLACDRLAALLEAQGGDPRGAAVGTWGDPFQTARELVRRLEALPGG